MRLLSILGGNSFVMFNKELAHEVSVNGAIIFGQLCSSYESFKSKDMLTVRDGKEFFYLTSEVIEEETALSYRQQVKAIKDLEEAGYIETVIMGSPAKKYFHITEKIIKQLISKDEISSDKSASLKETNEQDIKGIEPSHENFSFDKSDELAFTKEQSKPEQKVQAYKNNNEKKLNKNIKNNFVNKQQGNKEEIVNKLITEYRLKGLSKELCLRVLDEVNTNSDIYNFGGYFRTCLENALYRHNVKYRKIDPAAKIKERLKNSNILFYNWLEDDTEELPY